MLGSPWDKLVILAIATSAIASTQTTIIPSSRTSFSMGRQSALPRVFARGPPALPHPVVLDRGGRRARDRLVRALNILSENALFDTLSALSLMIAFYYALTGLACAIYYRRELTKSVKNFLFIGVGPLVGAAILGFLFVKSAIDFADPENSYTGQTILGMAVPFVDRDGLPPARRRPARALAAGRARAVLRASSRSRRSTPRSRQAG